MPRFNFSAFVSKHSLADLGSFDDVHPQADWEANQNKNKPETSVSSKEATSVTSSQLEETLNEEIDALAMELDYETTTGTTAKSYADSPDLLRTPTMQKGSRKRKNKSVNRPPSDTGFVSFTDFGIDQLYLQEDTKDTSFSEAADNRQVTPTKELSSHSEKEIVNQQPAQSREPYGKKCINFCEITTK